MWMPLSRELPSADQKAEVDLAEYLGDANNVVLDGGVITSGPRAEDRTMRLDFDRGKEIGLYLAEGSFDDHMTLQIANVADGVHEFLDARGYNVYERTCNKGFRPYARFLESEFGTGSAGKRIPGWTFDTPAAFRAGLLSGYFDGDGTVGDSEVTATSKSGPLLEGIRELLRQFGVSTTLRETFTRYDGEKRTYRRLIVDSASVERFAEVVELSVASKTEQLRVLCADLKRGDSYESKDMIPNFGTVLNTAAREAGWTTRETYQRLLDELGVEGRARKFGESDVQWKRVVSVEPIEGERTVYDLDVALNDNFVANGVFVHNSNSASVITEKLLDNGFGLLIVDIDGEYYGLKEEYEILHVGADEECDIQITTDHAEKMATLALEKNVPIILDMSSFLDEEEAESVLTAVSRHLFAKAKKQKQPFLMLVEEVHEYIPENGSVGECGKMLIKIGKRGRKHGLGIVGISQRPADVKKDFITQCDWLVWHRLTWDNDTKVVRRVLDGEYASAVEQLGDGEAFLMTDWSESVRRVQFQRKRTFDAGATPGLEDFERPDLKSVSDDLVSELEEISEETQERESRIAELREELDRKNSRIAELERELQDARDMQRMASQFVDALVGHVEGAAPGRTERERMRDQPAITTPELPGSRRAIPAGEADVNGDDDAEAEDPPDGDESDHEFSAADILGRLNEVSETPLSSESKTEAAVSESGDTSQSEPAPEPEAVQAPSPVEGDDIVEADGDENEYGMLGDEVEEPAIIEGGEPIAVRELKADVGGFETKTRKMLAFYREFGPDTPLNAHFAAGGDGDRTEAYAHNRRLRQYGLIEHVGRGHYDYRLREFLKETVDGDHSAAKIEAYAREVEENALDVRAGGE
jgi:cell division septum initiation protein DivIVA